MITMAWIGASMWFIPVLGWNQILRKGPSQLPGDYANSATSVRHVLTYIGKKNREYANIGGRGSFSDKIPRDKSRWVKEMIG